MPSNNLLYIVHYQHLRDFRILIFSFKSSSMTSDFINNEIINTFPLKKFKFKHFNKKCPMSRVSYILLLCMGGLNSRNYLEDSETVMGNFPWTYVTRTIAPKNNCRLWTVYTYIPRSTRWWFQRAEIPSYRGWRTESYADLQDANR